MILDPNPTLDHNAAAEFFLEYLDHDFISQHYTCVMTQGEGDAIITLRGTDETPSEGVHFQSWRMYSESEMMDSIFRLERRLKEQLTEAQANKGA